jgi:hypothetical protein
MLRRARGSPRYSGSRPCNAGACLAIIPLVGRTPPGRFLPEGARFGISSPLAGFCGPISLHESDYLLDEEVGGSGESSRIEEFDHDHLLVTQVTNS